MRNFLETLLEGNEPTTDETVDTEVEKEIEESCLPVSTLIESVTTDVSMELNAALETYELGCIVGGVKVVSEGLDTEGAGALLEGAAKDFFDKILKQLAKIKDWFIGLVTKIGDKFSALGGDIQKKYTKCKADFEKNFTDGKFKFKGRIIDIKAGDDLFDSIKEKIEKCMEVPSDGTKLTVDDIDDKTAWQEIGGIIGKEVTNSADVVAAIKNKYGITEDEPEEVTVSSSDVATMTKVIEATTKENRKTSKESIKTVKDNCDKAVKLVKNLKSSVKEDAESVKKCNETISKLNILSGLYSSIVNTKLGIYGAAAKAYVAFMAKVAGGKGESASTEKSTEKEPAQDSMDFSQLFEGAGVDEIETDDESTTDEEESVKEGFEPATENQDLVDLAYSFLSV